MPDYRAKIRKHRLAFVYRIALAVAGFGVLAAIVYIQYKNHVYTDYEVISSINKSYVNGTRSDRLGECILTYSADGAHLTDSQGSVLWNQTFEMQNQIVEISGDVVAIGDYNGHEVYVLNSKEKLYRVDTTMPIRSIAVTASGRVAVAVADTKITWIYVYDVDGTPIYEIKTTMAQSGYPVSFAFSPNGELLGVSCIYVESGVVKSHVAFYNFGAVGSNKSDYLVNGYTYPDTIIPYIQFLSGDSAVAIGDDRTVFYEGDQIPTLLTQYIYEDEIQGVYHSDTHVGVLFPSDEAEARSKMIVYGADSGKVGTYYFDTDYHDIFFAEDYFVAYGNKECLIRTFDNIDKYEGTFSKTVNLMLPVGNGGNYRFLLMTDDSIDTIQMK